MKISETVSVSFRQITQVSEDDFDPIYGFEVIRDGVEIVGTYNWTRGGLRAALNLARSI